MEQRYLTDDRDERGQRMELVIVPGGNGDWYIGSVPEGQGYLGRLVRICTSGGAQTACPGLGRSVAAAYEAMKRTDTDNHG